MRNMRRLILAAAFFAAIVLPPRAVPSAGLGITVSPAKLELSIPRGVTYNIPVTVRNAGFAKTHVQATMVDFGVTMAGSYEFQKIGTRPYSLMKWASIRPREFDLQPGASQQVQLTISVPNQAKLRGEYAGIVFFQTRPLRVRGQAVAFSARVASKIYMTIPDTQKVRGKIIKMNSATGSASQVYRVLFKNTGNVHLYLRGQLQIQQDGHTIAELPLAKGTLVERGGERLIQISGKHLPRGTYQAIATIDYGGKTETGGEISFTVK